MKQTKRQPNKSIRKQVHHHVKLAVVPHKANQFMPHFVRSYSIGLVLLIVLVAALVPKWPAGESVLGVKEQISISDLANDVNRERERAGAATLVLNKQLSRAAFLKAKDMFAHQYWSHDAPNGTKPWKWFSDVGYNYAYAGENLAKNFSSATATTAGWMGSQKHRENMLDPQYTDVGLVVMDGVLEGKNTTLIVALFGRPASLAATGAMTSPTEVKAATGNMSYISRFGVALYSMSPAVLGSIVLLLSAAIVALVAHSYRKQLPKSMRRSWRYHHGLYKGIGLTAVAFIIVTLYSGGQI